MIWRLGGGKGGRLIGKTTHKEVSENFITTAPMINNLLLGPDAQAQSALQMLRAGTGAGVISAGRTDLPYGLFLSNDPEAAIAGRYRSDVGQLLSLQTAPAAGRTPRWQALHIPLGPADLTQAAVMGVVARSQAPTSITTRIALRSKRGDSFADVFFGKTLISFAEPSTHLDAIELDRVPDIPAEADWRDLILFFQGGALELDLLDLRFFIV